jgi:predicted enzyme related to lactoylglutathione lyase
LGESLRGRWIWMELLTDDPDGSAAFYRAVFGWGAEIFDSNSKPYTMFTAHGVPIGGVMRIPPGASAPPAWLGYLGAPDVDATVAAAIERGGHVFVLPTDVATVGRFAVVGDPWGATFAVYRPQSGGLQEESPAASEFSWHELATDDVPAALDFYRDLFGWQALDAHDLGDLGSYQLVGRGAGRPIGGIFRKPMPDVPSAWLSYVRVAELEPALERVRAAGGTVSHGPQEVPGGDRIAICADPRGAAFALHWIAARSPKP